MDLDGLLGETVARARAIGIPVSPCICPHVQVNRRAVARFGCCVRRGTEYTIEVSARLLEEPTALRETLAHEVLHTCRGCGDHGPRWKSYAAAMGAAYSLSITRTGTWEGLGLENQKPVNHLLVCTACGLEIPRTKASRLVQHPERYRCKCGGRLTLRF